MWIKSFKLSHLKAIRSWMGELGYNYTRAMPRQGWVVIEHETILACGFFREVEGDILAVEGPYADPKAARGQDAKNLLLALFEARAEGKELVRLKPYKPARD